jgi:hypothetical protein
MKMIPAEIPWPFKPPIFQFFDGIGGIITNTAMSFYTNICVGFWEGCLALFWMMQEIIKLVVGVDLTVYQEPKSEWPTGIPEPSNWWAEAQPAMAKALGLPLWISVVLAITLAIVQLGIAAAKRDAKSLGRVVIGTVQYLGVWAVWFVVAEGLSLACLKLSTSIMADMIANPADLFTAFARDTSIQSNLEGYASSLKNTAEATGATALALMGPFVVLAGIGHLVIQLTMAVAKIVLLATSPISAAGLMTEGTKTWWWKTLRWYIAACFAYPLSLLVMNVGVKYAEGVVLGGTDLQNVIGSLIASVIIILVAVVSPMALFKLLAFVDPTSASGAEIRASQKLLSGLGNAMSGGVPSLFSRKADGDAASVTEGGRSGGEKTADSQTGQMVGKAAKALATGGTSLLAGADSKTGNKKEQGSQSQDGQNAGAGLGDIGKKLSGDDQAGKGLAGGSSGLAGIGQKFTEGIGGLNAGQIGGLAAAGLGKGLSMFGQMGAGFAALGTDIAGQAGVGHPVQRPDLPQSNSGQPNRRSSGSGSDDGGIPAQELSQSGPGPATPVLGGPSIHTDQNPLPTPEAPIAEPSTAPASASQAISGSAQPPTSQLQQLAELTGQQHQGGTAPDGTPNTHGTASPDSNPGKFE